MFDGLFQPMHLIVILFIALMVFGPKKLPELGKGLGDLVDGKHVVGVRGTLGIWAIELALSACRIWPNGHRPAGFHAPLQSNVPVLVIGLPTMELPSLLKATSGCVVKSPVHDTD